MESMTPFYEQMRCCGAGEVPDSELWAWIARAASGPIRRLVSAHRLDPSLADDLGQELSLYLWGRAAGRPLAFRGASDDELRRFIERMAIRFSRKLLGRWRRTRRREAEALLARPHPVGAGPGESQVRIALAELESLLGEADRHRLRVVRAWAGAGDPPGGHAPGPRTCYRWSEDLYRRYAREVL